MDGLAPKPSIIWIIEAKIIHLIPVVTMQIIKQAANENTLKKWELEVEALVKLM